MGADVGSEQRSQCLCMTGRIYKRATNASTYGLNTVCPGRFQPELQHEYLCISQTWHRNAELIEEKGHVFSWQAGHKRATNVSTYGLDQAYPGRLQPELLYEYLRISQIWHRWLGFSDGVPEQAVNNGIVGGEKNVSERDEPKTPSRKRQYVPEMDDDEDMSPKSQRLVRKLEYRKAKKALKEKYR